MTERTLMIINANMLRLRLNGASDADIDRGIAAAQVVFLQTGADAPTACEAATSQELGTPEEPRVKPTDAEWDLAEIWRRAESDALDAARAGRANVYANLGFGEGLTWDNGPGDWEAENPVSFGVEAVGINDKHNESLQFSEQWQGACSRYSNTLINEIGDNNAVVDLYLDATQKTRPAVQLESEEEKHLLAAISQARAAGRFRYANSVERSMPRRNRMPYREALSRWKLVTAKAEAAAMEGMLLWCTNDANESINRANVP